jgi:hypothetical protein
MQVDGIRGLSLGGLAKDALRELALRQGSNAVAAIATPPTNGGGAESGTLVRFSIGNAVVRFEVGAGSDDDSNPTWAAARTIALEGTKGLAKSWAKRPAAASC